MGSAAELLKKGAPVNEGVSPKDDLLTEVFPGQPASPTKAEINALVFLFKGEHIPEDVAEASIHGAPSAVEGLIKDVIAGWNNTPANLIECLKDITFHNLAGAFTLKERTVEEIKLKGVNLVLGAQMEVVKSVTGRTTTLS